MSIVKSQKSLHGVHVPHHKNTEDKQSVFFQDAKEIRIPMQQHMGAPCKPLVKAGDSVKVGQKIGDSEEFFSVPIHASCSGTVKKVEDFLTVNGAKTKAVVIENDGAYTWDEQVKKPDVTDKKSFLEAVRESGLVGLGGAGFPAHVKLAYQDPDRITKLVINGAECEPYITADFRECMENTENVLDGIRAVCQYLEIQDVYLGIESNKPEAIRLFDEKTANDPHFHVVELKQMYPQGAEKSIIYATTGIVVKAGKLPADCGVLVMNVSSVGFLGGYLKDGKPLVSKRITVDGDAIEHPDNLIVPIGTPIQDVLDHCGVSDSVKKVLMGGPMMGIAVSDMSSPVIKNNNAILAFSYNEIREEKTTACIRCGSCVSACPMNLMPAALEKAYDRQDGDALMNLRIDLCINCGCCSYVCPANRQLAQKNQLAKVFARNHGKKKV
ncbi:MAG: electron transport complex subunit RsxC [Massiliimalia sp.]